MIAVGDGDVDLVTPTTTTPTSRSSKKGAPCHVALDAIDSPSHVEVYRLTSHVEAL